MKIPPVFSSLLLVVLSQTFSCLVTDAQSLERISRKDVAKRQAVSPLTEALARGQAAMRNHDFSRAHEEFRTAVGLFTSGKAHRTAVDGFCKSGVALARQRIADGKYSEAESVLRECLDQRYDPKYRPAAKLLAKLQRPENSNRTMGPRFIAKVEEVRNLLAEADDYYASSRYDLAFKKYEQVLALDPYNVAARRGQEKIDQAKSRYGQEAYGESRARSLWHVEKAWEQPVRQYGQTLGQNVDGFQRDATGTARISNKLNSIIIPRIEFRDASIREAIDFLRQQAAENDPSEDGKKGVDIVLRLEPLGQIAPPPIPVAHPTSPIAKGSSEDEVVPEGAPVPPAPAVAPVAASGSSISPADARITITLNEIPFGEALRYVASQAGLKIKVEPYAVSIIPMSEQSNDLITKEYRVPPDFIGTSLNPRRVGIESGRLQNRRRSRGHGQGHAGIHRRTATGESRKRERISREPGCRLSARSERELPSAKQPAHCAQYAGQPRTGRRHC